MDGPQTHVGRILVIARPALGRMVEATLRGAGYEVYRTPGDLDFVVRVARLRPHMAIVALDLPWMDALEAVQPLIEEARPVPVLLLGEAQGDPRLDGVPRLPLAVDAALLLTTVSGLLATPDPRPGG